MLTNPVLYYSLLGAVVLGLLLYALWLRVAALFN
jgi:hypothetical protein